MVTTQPGKILFWQDDSLPVGRSSYIRETLRHQTQDGWFTWVLYGCHIDTDHWSSVTLPTATYHDFLESQGTIVRWIFLPTSYWFPKLMSNGARFPQTWEETLNFRIALPTSQLLESWHGVASVFFHCFPAIIMTLRTQLFQKTGRIGQDTNILVFISGSVGVLYMGM